MGPGRVTRLPPALSLGILGVGVGFRPEGLLMIELPLSPARYPTVPKRTRFVEEVLSRVRALPRVAAAGTTTNVPMQRGTTLDSIFEVEGRPNPDPSQVPIAERFSVVLVATLAAAGLLLAALGLYGVVAYTVRQRTGEIGLRMALGARPSDVLRLVVGQGFGLVAAGLLLGIAGAWTLARLLAGALFEVSPSDPATFGAVAAVLAASALLACWLPARRAARIDPMSALRCE